MVDTDTDELQRIEEQMAELDRQAKIIKRRERKRILGLIIKYMDDYEISTQDIEHARMAPVQIPRGQAHTRVKYRNPETGQSWSGRGKAPRWLAEKEEQGISRETFRADGDPGDGNQPVG